MVALKVSAFGGMIPAQDDRLLPENNAALSENTYLDSGALQGLRVPRSLHTMVNVGYKYAFRIPQLSPDKNHIFASDWWEFLDPDTNVLRSQVANDTFERYYFMSPTQAPGYNTKARVLAANPSFVLGIPGPATAPAVVVTGGVGATETRSYVYTWVSAYGEEGPPSPPFLQTGFTNGSWDITLTAPTVPDTTNRNLTRVRIYRTVTNTTGGASYFLVVDQAIATLLYSDTLASTVVAAAALLQSQLWSGPPSDLEGFVSMPNGMMAAWRSNEVWFCEPFRPHAWPASYTTSVDGQIVGLGVVGQTLVILTDGFPYSATGVNPANMAFSKIATFEPCMSRASIVSTANGVFYASPNGICLAAYGIVQVASLPLATKDRWLELVKPEGLRAARLGPSYYAFGSSVIGSFQADAFQTDAFDQVDIMGAITGILINLTDSRIAWTSLTSSQMVENVMTDIWSGEVFIVRDGVVRWLDVTANAYQGVFKWRSKQYQLSEQRNLGAMRIWFEPSTNDPSFSLNATRNTASPQTLAADQYGLVRVYVNGLLVMTRELRTPGEVFRLPGGFKNVYYQFEIEARVRVFNMEVASSVKELGGV